MTTRFLTDAQGSSACADIAADDDYAIAKQLGAKYGADLRQADGPGQNRVVVSIRPTRVNAVDLSG